MQHAATNAARTARQTFTARQIASISLVSFIGAVYLELFHEAVSSFRYGEDIGLLTLSVTPQAICIILAAFAVMFGALALLHVQRRILGFLFKWRYVIGIGMLAVLVLLQISGSSIALWSQVLAGAANNDLDGVLYGIPRYVRSDEWLVFTPLGLSQEYTGYSALSDIVRGVPTNLTLIYAQPAYAIATAFRPFFLGYLLLGSAYGLAFFWCSRLAALFFVSFEFGRLITNDDRWLSLAYALLLTFAPIVQWWFSVNGCAELLVFGQGIVLSFSAWLGSSSKLRSIGYAALFAYCTGGFVLIVYPAWQVCVGYIVAALCLAQLFSYRSRQVGLFNREVPLRRRTVSHIVPMAIFVALCAACLAVSLLSATDVISIERNTVYPGNRVETGGGLGLGAFNWVFSWIIPLQSGTAFPNASESAAFFSLFPIGFIASLLALRRRRDPVIIALVVVEAILLVYGLIGLPAPIAKVMLLSHVTVNRLPFALGLADTMLLVRAIAVNATCPVKHTRNRLSEKRGLAIRLAISAIVGIATVPLFKTLQPELAFSALVAMAATFAFLACYVALSAFSNEADAQIGLLGIACIIAVSGLCVNPLQQGLGTIGGNEVTGEASAITAGHPGSRWIADDPALSQALIAAGVPTVSSVALYPDLGTWRAIDPDGSYESVYNRYAHISVFPTDGEATFELVNADSFEVRLNADDLEKLDVEYWLSRQDLAAFSTERTTLEPISTFGSLTIYHVGSR